MFCFFFQTDLGCSTLTICLFFGMMHHIASVIKRIIVLSDKKAPASNKPSKIGPIGIALLVVAIVLLFAFFLKDLLIPLVRLELAKDVEGASELIRGRGILGILTVVLVEALQMVVVFIPAEFIQISSALSFPFPVAVLLCDLGVCLGASIIYVLVRVFHVRNDAYEKRQDSIAEFSGIVHERNIIFLLYFLFLMPLIPFGAICYYGSGKKLPYGKYIRTVATGVLPSIVTSNLMGAAGLAFLRNRLPLWVLILIIIFLGALLLFAGILIVRRVYFRDKAGTPESMTYFLLFTLVRLLFFYREPPVVHDEKLKDVSVPYIMLVNHESFFDFWYVSRIRHPKSPAFLVNEHYVSRPGLKRLSKACGLIPKKIFNPDMHSVAGMMRTLKKGFPIIIFPEARLSPDGRSNVIVERGAGFYKKLGADLVLTKLAGAYFAKPKWRPHYFRSRVTVTVERVLKADEIARMGTEELDGLIQETLYQDASETTTSRYRQKRKAKGLEEVLYRCADCGSLYTTVGRGNALVCTRCGATHTLDESYHFTDEMGSIPAYYDRIKAMEEKDADDFCLEAPVRTKIFGENGGPTRKETGLCRLDPAGFRYTSPTTEFTIPIEKLPALAFSCKKEFELYYQNELYYFYPVKDPVQVVRWAMYVDILSERRRERT